MKVQYNVEPSTVVQKKDSEYRNILLKFFRDKNKNNAMISCRSSKSATNTCQGFRMYAKEEGINVKVSKRGNNVFLFKEAADA